MRCDACDKKKVLVTPLKTPAARKPIPTSIPISTRKTIQKLKSTCTPEKLIISDGNGDVEKQAQADMDDARNQQPATSTWRGIVGECKAAKKKPAAATLILKKPTAAPAILKTPTAAPSTLKSSIAECPEESSIAEDPDESVAFAPGGVLRSSFTRLELKKKLNCVHSATWHKTCKKYTNMGYSKAAASAQAKKVAKRVKDKWMFVFV